MTCDGLHALDVWAGLDAEGVLVVRPPEHPGWRIPSPPDDDEDELCGAPYSRWTFAYLEEARGFDLEAALGPEQTTLLREYLDELQPPLALPSFAEIFERAFLTPGRGLVDGGSFLFNIPAGTPAVWGKGSRVAWAEGEPAMLAGGQGTGKTTVAGQLALGLAGVPGFEEVLGLPVRPLSPGKRVLYLALDRPRQIARCLRRMASPEHRDLIAERVVFWQGALPFSILKAPEALATWCAEEGFGAVIVDSLKDLVPKLSDEEQGGLANTAFQACVVEGVQVFVLHHSRKANADNRRPRALDDVHGSGNLTRGCGSVLFLFGAPGDEQVELLHVKQPAEPVGPAVVLHDHETGRSSVLRPGSLPSGQREDRKRAIRSHFTDAGGIGSSFATSELEAAGLGSKRTLLRVLSELVAEGWLSKTEGGGSDETTWTMIPLVSADFGLNHATPDRHALSKE